MKAIVNVDKNWGIGHDGDLLQFIPGDMKFFKENTIGNVVVMGRTTFDSLPGKQPLKDRTNIVLTKNKSFQNDGVIVLNSVEEVLKEVTKYSEDEVYIIGGEMIYKQLLPYCKEAYITKNSSVNDADKFFPRLDQDSNWEMIYESEKQQHKDIEYVFTTYKNNNL